MTKAAAEIDLLSSQAVELGNKIAGLHGAVGPPRSQSRDPSPPELEAEFGYYVELSAAKDVAEFKQRINAIIERLGFSEYAFVRLASSEDSGELMTVSPELIDAYYKNGYHEHDLALPYASVNTDPIFRSTINEYVFQAPFNLEQTRCMREIYELNKSYSYYEFYNVPAKAKNGNGHVLLSVTRRGMTPVQLKRQVQTCYSDLELLCEAIDFVATRKFPEALLGENAKERRVITINPRPLHVLDTLANNDLNIAQVADKLGISVVTANRHLQAARKAFSAKTNYAAIKQAVLSGLIEYRK